jgi:hypothetical protein
MRQLFAIVCSLFLGLFIVDAVISFADSSLLLFFDIHLLTGIRAIIGLAAMLFAVLIYCLMGLSPMIPKRQFIALALFDPLAILISIPFLIFHFNQTLWIDWVISSCQVLLGLWVLYRFQRGLKFRWQLVPEEKLGPRTFSWRNLSGFVLANLLVLFPAAIIYLMCLGAVAVDHFTDGFMSLRPGGLTVHVRKYVRNDGKTIQLFPMSHIADAGFYRKVSQSFPTNSIVLTEGVTDEQHLLTNKINYRRMARSLGVAEQHENFNPTRGTIVRADIDVDQFTTNTIVC